MPTKQKTNVVLVDDDDFLLDMYALKFKERDIEVKAFSHAADALTYIKEGNIPDLLISDIVMPGMDGLALLKELQEAQLDAKPAIVMLSNQGQDVDIEQAKSLGADGYIIKANAVPSEVITKCLEVLEQTTS